MEGGNGGGGTGEKPPRKWKDWVLERETELRLEVPDQDSSLIDVKVRHASPSSLPTCERQALCTR